MKLRTLIVDDEPLARRRLELLLDRLPDVECVGSASGCSEGHLLTQSQKPDVVLLDIRMRDGTGFDYLAALDTQTKPFVIFVTAFDRHAVKAFEANALDFLVKPAELDRLEASLKRARISIEQRDRAELASELEEIVANMRDQIACDERQARYESEIWVRHRVSGFVRVAVEDIDWLAAEDDYVRLVIGENSHLFRGTLKDMESRLDPGQFLRIHRSTIVQTSRIVEFRRDGLNLTAVLRSGAELRVGRLQARKLRARLAEIERGIAVGLQHLAA